MSKSYHFTNSKAGQNYYEPILKNRYEVQITPPDAISNTDEWGTNRVLITDAVKTISELKVDLHPGIVEQKFRGTGRLFAGGIPDKTTHEIVINFTMNLNDTNQNYIYNAFRKWSDLIYNPLNGTQTLKKDYVSPSGMTIIAFNPKFEVYRKWEFKNVFIGAELPAFSFDYESDTALDISVTFVADYHTQAYK